ncbi:hypothetical protein [Bradyrhizobium sp.]|uniref:hypothetical protein n=1 Tax=Bradyrhizobium sp. TaxID=376 RepID=UPI0025B8842A|nr:hypothetical protein [Bradyrhizobium sp.]
MSRKAGFDFGCGIRIEPPAQSILSRVALGVFFELLSNARINLPVPDLTFFGCIKLNRELPLRFLLKLSSLPSRKS